MSHFIIRAELHKPYPTDIYERLHAVMLQSNYFRIIQSSEGAFYNLPPAEYSHYTATEDTANQVLNRVWPIVTSVHPNSEVFVSKLVSWAAWGLSRTAV